MQENINSNSKGQKEINTSNLFVSTHAHTHILGVVKIF